MTPLMQLSELARSFFSLWALLLCILFIFGGARAVLLKRPVSAVGGALGLGGSYFLWQALFDVHLFGNTPAAVPVSRAAAGVPYLWWIFCLCALTAAGLGILTALIRRGRRNVTPEAVKLCLDSIPCGVCCYDDDGRVLFSNVCMHRLSGALTGERLLDGAYFAGKTAGSVQTVEGRKWRFTARTIAPGRARLHELIAADVTEEYVGIETLQTEKEALSRLNRELREYALFIDETVRREEILQAKARIHDEMNRLMLSTVAVTPGDTAEENRLFALWEQNALLLCMDADANTEEAALRDIENLAAALKLRLVFSGPLPAGLTEAQKGLFFSAAGEALANAAKHAGAKKLEISFTESETEIVCAFMNDGLPPAGEIRFTGGLNNLSLLAARQGARVEAAVRKAFTLSLIFPKIG